MPRGAACPKQADTPFACLPCSCAQGTALLRFHLLDHLSPPHRLPLGIVTVELSCIRDWLPQPLSQLAGLQRLHVRRGLVSEGVLLTEYEALGHLKGGTGRMGKGGLLVLKERRAG